MIVFGKIRNNIPSRQRYYIATAVMWLYVIGWLSLGYLILVWDIRGYSKFLLELVIIALAPWPLKGLFQSYDSYLGELVDENRVPVTGEE